MGCGVEWWKFQVEKRCKFSHGRCMTRVCVQLAGDDLLMTRVYLGKIMNSGVTSVERKNHDGIFLLSSKHACAKAITGSP